MPPILIYFATGLFLSLLIGLACYFTLGSAATPLFSQLFGSQAGAMWGRLFRVTLVTVAICGGLTVKFYGCSGPTDYRAVASSHDSMLRHTAAQTCRAIDYEVSFATPLRRHVRRSLCIPNAAVRAGGMSEDFRANRNRNFPRFDSKSAAVIYLNDQELLEVE